jgi:hypothetical protein
MFQGDNSNLLTSSEIRKQFNYNLWKTVVNYNKNGEIYMSY